MEKLILGVDWLDYSKGIRVPGGRADQWPLLAGTAEAFPDIVSANPLDIDATASAIRTALDTDSVTASAIMRRMREQVKTKDLEWRTGENITALRALL